MNMRMDWALLTPTDSNSLFSNFVQICPENELPGIRASIGIKDHPFGLLSSESSAKLTVNSVCTKIVQSDTFNKKTKKCTFENSSCGR